MFKPLTLNSQVTYVHSADPAVDWDQIVAAELEADPALRDDPAVTYQSKHAQAEERFMRKFTQTVLRDPASSQSLLKFKAGESPTKYVIGVIPPDEMCRIADECRLGQSDEQPMQARWRAFLSGLRNIENLGGQQAPRRKVGDIEYVDPAWLRANFGRGLRQVAIAVGLIVWRWNQLTEDEIKN